MRRPFPTSHVRTTQNANLAAACSFWLLGLVVLASNSVTGQNNLSSEARGAALALQLRTQKPAEPVATTGFLRQRNPDGKWHPRVPLQFEVRLLGDSWQSIYRVLGGDDKPIEVLVVTHHESGPNIYEYWGGGVSGSGDTRRMTLQGDAAAIPFAGSEFWLTDLGLEFLYWPGQNLIGNQMRKGRACHILESIYPNPSMGAYARVRSWVDVEHCGILRAEAYDQNKRLVKEFNIGSFKKISGKWQLKSMEIRNDRTDALTRLEFDLEIEDKPQGQDKAD
ncbi:MAG: outer membrane lipoprotein-sorting protein [Verrucomicrobiota bacterium]|nr:outer membrane lipoprotein-sorting protein [Verrucomicrobiota bacterium]